MANKPLNIDFMGRSRLMVGISLVIMVIGLISMIPAVKGLNLGIDFTGGTQAEIRFEQQHTVPQVSDVVQEITGKTPTVKTAELKGGASGSAFLINTVSMDEAKRAGFYTQLEAKLGKFERLGEAEVSGTIRSELILNALLAVGIASVLQIVYIAFRFEFKFAISAIAAMLHDLVLVLGLMSILHVELGPPFVAALLTVIGYSVNDSIVVFDRVRELVKTSKKSEPIAVVINRSVNETLSRTINTGISVWLALLAIIFLGGESTFDFAVALFIGLTSGTYSSVFIASALLMWWKQWESSQRKRVAAAR